MSPGGQTPAQTARSAPVCVLCITQVISWGTLYYAFPVFLHPAGVGQGWKQDEMVGAFSLSLLLAGVCAYPVGRLIHDAGGRAVMSIGSLVAAAALGVLSLADSLPVFYAAWAMAGVAMACALYEAAFSVLAGIFDSEYKRAVTTVTLAGGFASSVFWPLTERLVAWFGWREAVAVYVVLHLGVCFPLHWFGLPATRPRDVASAARSETISLSSLVRIRTFWLLAGSYMLNAVVFSVVSVHLVPLFQLRGLAATDAACLAACAGPMQVLGRLIEFRFGDRWSAMQTGIVALGLVIPALIGFAIWPMPIMLVALAVSLYGISNGVMTIVRSVSVVEVFGRDSYAGVNGALTGPALVSRSLGPLVASIMMDRTGGYGAVLLTLVCLGLVPIALFSLAMRNVPCRPTAVQSDSECRTVLTLTRMSTSR